MRLHPLSLLLMIPLLSACASGGQPRFNVPALPQATSMPPANPARVIATLPQRIDSFDVSPDGKLLALATSGGVRLYELPTYQYLRGLNDGELASAVAWSPDGRRMAVGSSKDYGKPFFTGGDSSNSWKAHLTVWDASTWKPVFEPAFGDEMVNEMFRDLAWSPDNRSLASSLDTGGVQVLDTQTGQTISRQKDFASSVDRLAWSPDGSRLLATSDMAYTIRRWRLSNGQAVRLFDRRVGNAMDLAWSPDGKRIASGHVGGGVCFWTALTNRCDGFIQAHRTATFSLAWSPDGSRLATGGGVIRLWDTATGELLRSFGEEADYVYSHMQWLRDGSLVTLQYSPEEPGKTALRLWDPSTGSLTAEWRGRRPAE
ncbi:MAG TPA: WD40 repeat domain-containing protein [Anaerolineales bacterium]|nr:WD40 repeat domain-containing protein [Anaerolineales bacterium]